MRVLMIVDTAPPLYGGAGQQALNLTEELEQFGHEIKIFARQKRRVFRQRYSKVKFAQPFLGDGRVSRIIFAIQVFILVLFSRAQIVHIHGVYLYAITGALAAKIRKKALILKITRLGSDDPSHLATGKLGSLRILPFRLANLIVALNASIAESVHAWSREAPVRIIPNGVVLPQTRQNSAKWIEKASVSAVFVGEISKRKGIDTLLDAWPIVLDSAPGSTLSLVGPTADEIAISDRLRIESEDSIKSVGAVSKDEVRNILESGNLFIFPSRSEGLPNALIEAMAHGLPCVASDIPENRAAGGDAILYFNVESSEDLARAILKASSEAVVLAEAASLRAKYFDIQKIAIEYNYIYTNIQVTEHPN